MKPKNETASAGKEQEIVAQDNVPLGPRHEQIEQRAYEIHVEGGGVHGKDLEDWLQAERELKAKYKAG